MSGDLFTAEYRDVVGFPGYRVGSDGSVWSRRGRRWSTFRRNWVELKPKYDARGRTRITLYRETEPITARINGRLRRKGFTRFVHHLVLEAFVGPRPRGMVGCHRNDDSSDNRLKNLRWDTHKSNAADALRNGRYARGEAHHHARFTESQIREIRKVHAQGISIISLARITGVSEPAIKAIVNGVNWSWLH